MAIIVLRMVSGRCGVVLLSGKKWDGFLLVGCFLVLLVFVPLLFLGFWHM